MQNAQKAIDFCKTGEYYQYISFRKFRNSCFRRVLEEELTKFGRKKEREEIYYESIRTFTEIYYEKVQKNIISCTLNSHGFYITYSVQQEQQCR